MHPAVAKPILTLSISKHITRSVTQSAERFFVPVEELATYYATTRPKGRRYPRSRAAETVEMLIEEKKQGGRRRG
jgi:hypothetical protein